MRSKGLYTEQLAAEYLQQQGLQLLISNFSNRAGEIDLIMQEQQTLIFVEVKYRAKTLFGRAIEAVSYKKQQKIKQCATFYLQQQGVNAYNSACRFDVVGIEGSLNQPTIIWLKNAF
jgi:putative endonuclease